jgi:hypothetical protein
MGEQKNRSSNKESSRHTEGSPPGPSPRPRGSGCPRTGPGSWRRRVPAMGPPFHPAATGVGCRCGRAVLGTAGLTEMRGPRNVEDAAAQAQQARLPLPVKTSISIRLTFAETQCKA